MLVAALFPAGGNARMGTQPFVSPQILVHAVLRFKKPPSGHALQGKYPVDMAQAGLDPLAGLAEDLPVIHQLEQVEEIVPADPLVGVDPAVVVDFPDIRGKHRVPHDPPQGVAEGFPGQGLAVLPHAGLIHVQGPLAIQLFQAMVPRIHLRGLVALPSCLFEGTFPQDQDAPPGVPDEGVHAGILIHPAIAGHLQCRPVHGMGRGPGQADLPVAQHGIEHRHQGFLVACAEFQAHRIRLGAVQGPQILFHIVDIVHRARLQVRDDPAPNLGIRRHQGEHHIRVRQEAVMHPRADHAHGVTVGEPSVYPIRHLIHARRR